MGDRKGQQQALQLNNAKRDVDGCRQSQTPAEEKCEGKGVPREADKERSVNA